MLDTLPYLVQSDFPQIKRAGLESLQVNLGYRCNLRCQHCHVNAGPTRSEIMDEETVGQVMRFIQRGGVGTLDLTGGAPELHPHFRALVTAAREAGIRVIDRCNLTILEEPGMQGLAEFLAAHSVEVVASMPCYLEENVDHQRGRGVFERNIQALKRLNALGYGVERDKPLKLVFNPQGPTLPPEQQVLEEDFKRHLSEQYGIVFNQLLTITNMPIRRFGSMLLSTGQFTDYMQLLKRSFEPANLDALMCRHLISVDWRGYLYDCDFNQMLDLPLEHDDGSRIHISQLAEVALPGRRIEVGDHCYGCAAGQGSSCGGALE